MRYAAPSTFLALVLLLGGLPSLFPVAPVGAEEPEGRPIDAFFRGKVIEYDDGTLTLRYDFAEKNQMEDWYEALPFPIRRLDDQIVEWLEETLEVRGSTGTRHIAQWKGDLEVRCTLTPEAERDLGGMITPASDTEDFATFSLVEKYFHKWDRQSGGQHAILKFGKQFRKRGFGGDFVGFRYVARKPPVDPIVVGRGVALTYGVKRGRLYMDVAGQSIKGKDLGVKLKEHRPGFYCIKGRLRVDDVEIRGTLDPAWMREVGVLPTLETPIEEDDG